MAPALLRLTSMRSPHFLSLPRPTEHPLTLLCLLRNPTCTSNSCEGETRAEEKGKGKTSRSAWCDAEVMDTWSGEQDDNDDD
eukprot:3276981-Pyramimonas_sp.AAC.1